MYPLYFISAGIGSSVVNNPITNARTTPIRKAHAPIEFSCDFNIFFKLFFIFGKINAK